MGGGAGDPCAFEGHGAVLMQIDNVRSVLAPLGLLVHPVVVLTNRQQRSEAALTVLLQGTELRPRLHVVPEGSW